MNDITLTQQEKEILLDILKAYEIRVKSDNNVNIIEKALIFNNIDILRKRL